MNAAEILRRCAARIMACAFLIGVLVAPPRPAFAAESADAITPFKIHVADQVLRDLKQRLAHTRFPDQVGAAWEYGTDAAYLKELVGYWRDKFDWRAQERKLNQLPQFMTKIEGLDVHFVHVKSKQPGALPLIITHGWPGSFFEFTKIIGPLTDPVKYGGRAEDSFDVVAMSIPGYGFSEKPHEPGMNPARVAAIEAKLMARLGYAKYGVQGGDWGAIIGRQLAIADATHIVGLHLNMCTANAPRDAKDPNEGVLPAELDRMKARQATFDVGYQAIQGNRPQTLGYGLNDSPAGLAGWIVEKFRDWCDCGGDVEKRFSKDELLTNIMIYWVTETATSSARLYYESRHVPSSTAKVTVPTACAIFPKDVFLPPRRWIESQVNLKRYTEMPEGGHFAALEQPELLIADVRSFFHDLR